jgi:Ca2+-binding RTX toxin-like protein
MLPRVFRSLALLTFAILAMAIPASASATVTGSGVGASVLLESDGDGDEITLTCEGGMAPQGSLTQVPCGDVEAVIVFARGGNDTVKLENVGKVAFPALKRTEIDPGDGEDTVFGSQIADAVLAGEEDFVSGGAGNDFIEGAGESVAGEGDDVVLEAEGPESGGPGDDRFENARRLELTEGGPGTDTFAFDFPADESLSAHFGVEDDGLKVNSGPLKFAWASIEHAELFLTDLGTQSVDASGFSGSIEADGRGGPDTLIGSPGEDLLSGGSGNDDLTGGPGFDWVKGDAGADQLRLRDGGVDRGVCGDDGDTATADAVDSLFGCETIDLPAVVAAASPPTTTLPGPGTTPVPDTKGLKGPKTIFQGNPATFRFASTEQGGTFKCRIDKGTFKACKSPYHAPVRALSPGKHSISVFAVSSTGIADSSPATLKFNVVAKPKPHKRG